MKYAPGFILVTILFAACSQPILESQRLSPFGANTSLSLDDDSIISVSYFLPRQMAKVTVESRSENNECMQSARFEPLSVEPDVDHHYIAFFKHDPSREDSIDVRITDGLLSGTETEITSRTLDIFLELVKSVKAADVQSLAQTIRQEEKCKNFVRSAIINPAIENSDSKIKRLLSGTRLLIKIKRPGSQASTRVSPKDGKFDGLVYRRTLPYTVTICERMNGGQCSPEMREEHYRFPDSNSVMVIPVRSANFATTKHTLAFSQGEPTQVKIERDSELVKLVSFPLIVAKAILGVPAELLQLKVDYTNKEVEFTKAQRDLIEAQQELLRQRNSVQD